MSAPEERLRRTLAAGWLAIALAAPALADASAPDLRVGAEGFELTNGMRFVVVERPRAVTVSAGWLATVGTADDPPGRTGMAHSLEHMLFQGTGTLRPGELDSLYAAAGATGLNAMTRRDFTAFFVSLPAEKLELWFWLESDRLRDARFRDLDAERAAIVEERRLRVDANPTGLVEEIASAAFWGEHPYGRPNSGRPEELARLTLDELRTHFETHYRPEGLVAVLVGPVRAADVRPLAEAYFGRLGGAVRSSSGGAADGAPDDWLGGAPPGRLPSVSATCTCRPQVHLSYPAPAFGHRDSIVTELLTAVLNGRSGRLHSRLVLAERGAFAAYARYTRLRGAGRLTLIAEAFDDDALEPLALQLEGQLEELGRESVSPYELAKAKNRLAADTLRRLEEPSQLMLELLFDWGLGRGDLLDHWSRELQAVGSDDLLRLTRRILAAGQRSEARFTRPSEAGT